MKNLAAVFFLAGCLVLAWSFKSERQPDSPRALPISRVEVARPIPQIPADKREKAVQYFCQVDFHVESCVAYLQQCGKDCDRLLRDRDRVRIVQAFQTVRTQHGLPPIDTKLLRSVSESD